MAELWTLWLSGIASVGALAIAALIACLPFLLSFKNVLGLGIRLLVDGGAISDLQLPPGSVVSPDQQMHRTTLGEFLVIWAFFVFIALSYLVLRLWVFPWAAAVKDVGRLFGLGRKTNVVRTSRPSFSPDAAMTLQPAMSGLSPALAAASPGGLGSPITLNFRSEIPPDSDASREAATSAHEDSLYTARSRLRSLWGMLCRTALAKLRLLTWRLRRSLRSVRFH